MKKIILGLTLCSIINIGIIEVAVAAKGATITVQNDNDPKANKSKKKKSTTESKSCCSKKAGVAVSSHCSKPATTTNQADVKEEAKPETAPTNNNR